MAGTTVVSSAEPMWGEYSGRVVIPQNYVPYRNLTFPHPCAKLQFPYFRLKPAGDCDMLFPSCS